MSKRNPGLPRKPRDFYATPEKAVRPVLPYLPVDGQTFAEPCAGEGHLVLHLHNAGFTCTYAGDLAHGQNVFQWNPPSPFKFDFIITNPPWDRVVLHPMIQYLTSFKVPVWMLIDADWMHTKQAIEHMHYCTTIVSIGRVRWMPGTKMDGYDNACWYRFYYKSPAPPVFIPRN